MKDARIFLGREKNRGNFWRCKKGLREFWGYAKKVVIFLGRQNNSEVVIFLSIKYEPLSDPPPSPTPVIKICEWGP